MPIHFACPTCKTVFSADDKDVGTKVNCQTCGQRLEVPKPVGRSKTILADLIEGSVVKEIVPPVLPAKRATTEFQDQSGRYRSEGRAPLFGNEESIRVSTMLQRTELERMVEDAVGRLGSIAFIGRGEFEVSGCRLQTFATDVKVAGQLFRGRREDEWVLSLSYDVRPSSTCITIAVLGALFFLIGLAILIVPFTAKSGAQHSISCALRDFRDDVEAAKPYSGR